MKQKLTAKLVSLALPARKEQLIIRDSELSGFGIRISKQTRSWIVEKRINSVNKRITLGTFPELSLEEARRKAAKIIVDISLGTDPIARSEQERTAALTLQEALNQFLAMRNLREDTKLGYRRLVERHLHDWLEQPLRAITKDMVEEKFNSLIGPTRCGTHGKSRANRTFEVLRVVINWAADRYSFEGKPLIAANPVDRLNQNRQWFRLQPRTGTIPDAKLPEFYKAVMSQPKIARDYIMFLLFSALRRREAAKLKWSDIDFENKTLTILVNKSSRPHVLPLSKIMIAILESRKGNGSEYVFEGRDSGHINEPRAVLARLRNQMGWHWILHDLRRTGISNGEKAGVPFLALKAIAGHALGKSITERYIVVDSEFVRIHLEAMNRRLFEQMGVSFQQWQAASRAEDVIDRRVTKSGSGDLKARKNGGQKAPTQIKAVTLIEEPTIIATCLPAAFDDWEDEVYF